MVKVRTRLLPTLTVPKSVWLVAEGVVLPSVILVVLPCTLISGVKQAPVETPPSEIVQPFPPDAVAVVSTVRAAAASVPYFMPVAPRLLPVGKPDLTAQAAKVLE